MRRLRQWILNIMAHRFGIFLNGWPAEYPWMMPERAREILFRTELNYEVMYVFRPGKITWLFVGDETQVDVHHSLIPELWGALIIHNHPGGDEVKPGLSKEDLEMAIEYGYAAIEVIENGKLYRAEARK